MDEELFQLQHSINPLHYLYFDFQYLILPIHSIRKLYITFKLNLHTKLPSLMHISMDTPKVNPQHLNYKTDQISHFRLQPPSMFIDQLYLSQQSALNFAAEL